ncbi:MAG: NADH-quinone oxidoreductase subunit M [Planctomycetes bacterium]|nr:NADH-quinone oxidoreductase subunit M [Planctomycetota bacterium]
MTAHLPLLVACPILLALLLGLLPERAAKYGALLLSAFPLALAILLPAEGSWSVPWPLLPGLPVRFALHVDGLSRPLVLLTTFLVPVAILSAPASLSEGRRLFHGLLLAMEGLLLGTFLAADLFLFLLFWDAVLVPMALLIGRWGGQGRPAPARAAATRFFLYAACGSVLLLAGTAWVASVAGTTGIADLTARARTGAVLPAAAFLLFAVGFAVKVPLVPLHAWLPVAHVEAPTAGSILLAGVLLKMGAYAFLRVGWGLFPNASRSYAPALVAIAAVGAVHGALNAMAQCDIKKRIAYFSVSHMGLAMMGIFAGGICAAQGAVFHLVSHGLATGGLFFVAGALIERSHSRRLADQGRLAENDPVLAVAWGVLCLSSLAVPGLAGFVGEFTVLAGVLGAYPWAAVAAGVSLVLGAAVLVPALRQILFLAPQEGTGEWVRSGLHERVAVAALGLALLVIGLFPSWLLSLPVEALRRLVGGA